MANIAFETAAAFVSDVLQNSAYLSTLADKLAQGNSVYLKTLGFYAEGDGGGACYRVVGPVSSDTRFSFDNETALYYADGCFRAEGSNVAFKLLPQGNSINAEQFGVLPVEETEVDFSTRATYNLNMLIKLIKFAADNGSIVSFVSRDKIFVAPNTLALYSKSYIDGNGATLQIDNSVTSTGAANLFSTPGGIDSNEENIYVKNLNLVGRKTSATEGNDDQAFHMNAKNFTAENVSISQFCYGYHTFGKDVNVAYDLPPMANKNWLIKNCRIKNTVMGLNLSEIDGTIIKNSDIFGYIAEKGNHCLYFSSNCSNIRTTNTYLGNTAGGAIHKNYSPGDDPKIRGDISRNQFYTDIFIHNAETCWCIAYFCDNTMCDSNFATEINRVLVTGASTNCIIANSEVDEAKSTFITVWDAARFWMQDSHIVYSGHHRAGQTIVYSEDSFINKMSDSFMNCGLEDRRYHIGPDRDIAELRFKFTGSEIESTLGDTQYYMGSLVGTKNAKSKASCGEYYDNCTLRFKSNVQTTRIRAINKKLNGLTYRNCYMVNSSEDRKRPPFVYMCEFPQQTEDCEYVAYCPLKTERGCWNQEQDRSYPWLHFENNLYNRWGLSNLSNWEYYFNVWPTVQNIDAEDMATMTGAYSSNCYRIVNGSINSISNFMGATSL